MSTTSLPGADGNGSFAADAVATLALAAPWLAAMWLAPVPQWQSYHDFADQRALFGLPHALNVLSNLPFFVVGALGLSRLRTLPHAARAPYGVFFAGVLLTAFGSGWYHLDPRDATLVWDRLPIALGFAGLVAGTLADRRPRRAVPYAAAFAFVGLATVVTWAATGNLLPYIVMQASFLGAALFATACLPSGYTRARWLYGAAALYGAAVACEYFDAAIAAAAGGAISGHTLKHLLAALALAVVYAMLRTRRALFDQPVTGGRSLGTR